jgi:AraC-like DNA-binding protein
MTITQCLPTESLKSFIKAYLIIESHAEAVNRVLPDTSMAIAFQYKGQVNYVTDNKISKVPASAISGLRRSARLINYLKDTATFIVLFNATGASAFFKAPMYELFEESVSLDNFIEQAQISFIEEHLAGAENNPQRVAIVERFLLSKLSRQNHDGLILAALQKIHHEKGNIKIKRLANALFISQDAFEKRFRRIVGTTPKQYSSIVRMKSIIDQKPLGENLAGVVFEAGYFDLPHFYKDFKSFTGQTPTDFFSAPFFW